MISYVVLDLETTGFNAYSNEIIQIGAWKFKDNVLVEKFSTFVKPVQYIPREVQALTHITPEMVADYPSIEEILPEFYAFCEDLPFLGHNLQFDYNFLLVKGKSIGLDFSLGNKRTGIDTLKLSKKFFPNFKSHTLSYMVEKFNISLGNNTNFHNAEYDAYVTKLVYDRFLALPKNHTVQCNVIMPELLIDKKKTEYGIPQNNRTLSFE